MHRDITGWHSPNLNKHMDIVTYGHFGFALLLLPTAGADFLEYERFLMIDVIAPYISGGKVKVFSINSINNETWLHKSILPHHKSHRHNQYNDYIFREVVPYIKSKTSPDTPIILSGASLGALHSVNLYCKRPDLIDGVIGMSGVYDLTVYTDGYWDDNVYFNSPKHYLEHLHDDHHLPLLQRSEHFHLFSGSGDYESPQATIDFGRLLDYKGIPHEVDIWGPDMTHDWPTWRRMLPYILDSRF